MDSSSDTSCFVAVVANVVIGVLLVTLNIMFRYIKTYNCFVFAAVFVLLQGINPFLSTRFFAGTALCLVVVVTLFFMFEQYGKRGGASQGIFLVMALLSFFTIYHYVFFLLFPLYILGFAYMRVLDVRGVFAITTVVLTVLLTVSNFKTMLNYSVHVRAYNNFFVALSVFVVLMMAIDYNDFLIYMPLLNLCAAIQYGHWYVITPHETRQPVTMWLMVAMLVAYIIAMVIA